MTIRRVVLGVIGVLVLLVAAGLLYARPILLTATGYAAHNACAVELLVGRGADASADDLPPNPLVPLLRTTVDASSGSARSTLAGTFGQTAWHTEGLGCTLADSRPSFPVPEPVVLEDPEAEWPVGDRVVAPSGDEVDVEGLEAALDIAFAEDDAEGRRVNTRAVVVVHDSRIVAERYADGFDAGTRQLGWSIAKSATNAMVGRLVRDEQIAVDEDGLLDAWEGDRDAITVEDLLRMRSGLSWDETYDLGTPITTMLYLEPDMGAYAASQPLAHPVGEVQQYSSGTTNALCDVLTDRTGMGADMGHQLVFGPLGMTSMVLEPDASGGPVCSSYGWATPRDWARFGWLFAADGEWQGERLLPEGWVEWSSTAMPARGDGEGEGYGAHWWTNQRADGSLHLPDVPEDAFWASGHDGQRVFVIPSEGLVVVRMGFTPDIPNGELPHEAMLTTILDAIG
jgi:CubicO group peptidase (beta-lactamase class C family)